MVDESMKVNVNVSVDVTVNGILEVKTGTLINTRMNPSDPEAWQRHLAGRSVACV